MNDIGCIEDATSECEGYLEGDGCLHAGFFLDTGQVEEERVHK